MITLKLKTLLLFSLLLLSCCKHNQSNYSLKSDNQKKKNYQEGIQMLITKKYDTIIRQKALVLAYECLSVDHDFKSYFKLSKEIEKKSIKIHDTIGVISANMNMGFYYSNKFFNDSAYYSYTKAQKLSLKHKNKPFLETLIQYKSNILWSQHNFAEAEKEAIKALKIAIKKNNFELEYNCFITIANSLVGMNNNIKAIEYYEKALKTSNNLSEVSSRDIFKYQIYNYIAAIYQKQNQFQKSINYLKAKVNIDKVRKKDIAVYAYLTNTISYSKFKLGDNSVLKQFQETLKIGDSIQSIPIQITSKTYIGEYYLAQKDTLKANSYLKEAQLQAHRNSIFEDELKIIKLLQLANPSEETFYSDRYIQLNDSLQSVERATRDKFARIEFETDEITSEKDVVKKQNNQLLIRIWVITGFAVLSLLVLILWFMNKSQKAKTRELVLKQEQQKANEAIYQLMIDQQQQIQEGKNIEKQRISLELHDGVMGKLSAVRLNLYAALYKANLIEDELFAKQIDEIQTVEQEIRTIAHDLNSNLFSDNANFIGIVKELFAKIENHSQIQFTLRVSDAVNWDLVNNVVKINLYRILQESLQNIEKYAEATAVAVFMSKSEDNQLEISISDNGNGFDTNQKKNGIGLQNMKTRVVELKGKITIESAPKQGTKINLIIPF